MADCLLIDHSTAHSMLVHIYDKGNNDTMWHEKNTFFDELFTAIFDAI